MKTIILRNHNHRLHACDFINRLLDEPLMEVVIREHKSKKTLAQLRTIYGWFRFVATEHAEATGNFYTPDAWKIYFKKMFGVYNEVDTPTGLISEPKSLSDYSIKELSKLMDDVNHYCGSELHIYVPLPGMEE